ncbi:MAG: sulfite exporter TauE/SafE family protein, partial [Bacteroidota bacterium]
MLVGTAFFIGLFGSIHCLGMCGPLALALPMAHQSTPKRLLNTLLYHIGRILVYALLGTVLGLIGEGIWLAGLQRVAAIAMGIMLFLSIPFLYKFEQKVWATKGFQRWSAILQKGLGRLLQRPSSLSFFGVGALNGLLPCGMVYLALAGALTQNHPIDGFFYMITFGAGTLPLMLGLMFFGNKLLAKTGSWIRPFLYVSIWIIGLLSILRGFQVDLPVELDFLLLD